MPLAFAVRLVRAPRALDVAWLALCVGLQCLAGEPSTLVMMLPLLAAAIGSTWHRHARRGLLAIMLGLVMSVGIGAVTLAVFPRAAAITVYAVISWSLIVDLLGSLLTGTKWLNQLSLFHYMALAPAQDPDPTTLIITTAIALALGIVAVVLFERRDLQTA